MKYKSTGYVLKRLVTHLRVLTQHVCSHGLGSDRSHFDLSSIIPSELYTIIVNSKFWRTPIGRSRSRDAIASLLSGRLSAHRTRYWHFFFKI